MIGKIIYMKRLQQLLILVIILGATSCYGLEPLEDSSRVYGMEADLGERTNLYQSHPEVVQQLMAQLESDIARGRSTAGSDQASDVKRIVLWKSKK